MWYAFASVIVVVGVIGVLLFVCIRRSYHRRVAEMQLHAPLLPDSTDHRLDAALREAEEGFNECPACGFENFKRLVFCTVCGAAVVQSTSVIGSKIEPSRWRARKKTSLDKPLPVPTVMAPKARERRQRRAKMRKEWQRKVDVEGKMYWYRDGSANEGAEAARFPGYVLRVVQHTPSKPQPEEEEHPKEEPKTVATRARALSEELASIALVVMDASTTDASHLPLTTEPVTDAQRVEMLELSKQDFPSKYAHFVMTTAGLIVPSELTHLRLNISRESLFEDSIESLSVITSGHTRSVMRINFLGESGIDAGGVHREWLQLLIEKIVDPNTGIFTCVGRSEQSYYLNPHSKTILGDNHLVYFFATGRLLGRALLEGYVTGFHLALPLLKIILGLPVSFSDLEFFDPEAFQGLKWLADNNGVEHLGLDFTLCEQVGNEMVVVELLPNGRDIAVTDDNKRQYVDLKLKHLLFESVSSQLYALLHGLYQVIPPHVLMSLDPEELDYVLCGSDEIDVDDWERNTKYTEDLHEHRAMIWFWELVREMPNEYRRRLLLFATGSSRVPLAGFSALTSYDGKLCPFTLKGIKLDQEGYIVSHACFNRLDLPRHVIREELKTVLYAILSTELYGFTTA
ncbi:hypothetical protein Poli38472_003289 [Pythium oligandrum]|uniref:HECT-type E3 ubiquitin transferase n=1 Tax=Pythium oligandrum TaxID=41045 RepID=A0A8K1C6I9_PYTOL|nr:hypothetical protein Poli38472_003289 [Pythium oligandrum]|eukprot:TMW57364.1 hypothetical protein Poli38472_003289 [Pythium oligandrum]